MIHLPGGTFQMGSADFYPEERPVHEVSIHDFWLDETPVTVAQFAEFVTETEYVTTAETALNPDQFPGVSDDLLQPGSLVFTPTTGPVPLDNPSLWWSWTPGASWRFPEGPHGVDAVAQRGNHPVTQVSFNDASTFARWAGKRLPTEAEVEYAAGGGAVPSPYAWGTERALEGRHQANTFTGAFPYHNAAADGWERTSPVGSFPANGFGLYDMIGNVWEWTSDRWMAQHRQEATPSACCTPQDPRLDHAGSENQQEPGPRDAFVVKGGSHLCAPEYCLRYRPAARQPQERDTGTSHLGFRCAG